MSKVKTKRTVNSSKTIEQVTNALIEAEKKRIAGTSSVGITQVIKDVAEQEGASISAVRNRYYNHIKDKFGEVTKESTSQVKEEQQPTEKSSKPPYKSGEMVEVVVAKILDNIGVICKTTDDHKYQGLVHISRIADSYIESVRDYFTEGEVLNVRVDGLNNRGELELSTKGLDLKRTTPVTTSLNNTLATGLAEIREKLELEQGQGQGHTEELALLRKITNEEDKIIRYLNGVVGTVTPAAREELFNVIEEHGIFAFTLKMSEIAKDFSNDLGLLFIKQVHNSIKDDGL